MSEEKILKGGEKIEISPEIKKEKETFSEEVESLKGVERIDGEKIEKAQKEISDNDFPSQTKVDENLANQVSQVANLDKEEDQIQKLVKIASQEGPQKALKIARTLNSNYTLDMMHDRLIDEEKLRQFLLTKGFIEKIE
jgi:predicted Zn-dependent peptidase